MRNIDDSEWLARPGPRRRVRSTDGRRAQQFAVQAVRAAGFHRTSWRRRCRQQAPRQRRGRDMSIIDDLRALDTNDPGRWPLPIRIARDRPSRSSAVMAFGVYMFVINDRDAAARAARAKRRTLRATFEDRQRKAANFDAVPRAARRDRARLRRDAAPAARQDRGAEACSSTSRRPRPARASRRDAVPADRPRSRRTSTRSCRSSCATRAATTSWAIL
mgnify:CR=1 FL=1